MVTDAELIFWCVAGVLAIIFLLGVCLFALVICMFLNTA